MDNLWAPHYEVTTILDLVVPCNLLLLLFACEEHQDGHDPMGHSLPKRSSILLPSEIVTQAVTCHITVFPHRKSKLSPGRTPSVCGSFHLEMEVLAHCVIGDYDFHQRADQDNLSLKQENLS